MVVVVVALGNKLAIFGSQKNWANSVTDHTKGLKQLWLIVAKEMSKQINLDKFPLIEIKLIEHQTSWALFQVCTQSYFETPNIINCPL